MATQSRVITFFTSPRFRVGMIAFWLLLIVWAAVQMATGGSEVYPRQHLGQLLLATGSLLMVVASGGGARPWRNILLTLIGFSVVIAAAVVIFGRH